MLWRFDGSVLQHRYQCQTMDFDSALGQSPWDILQEDNWAPLPTSHSYENVSPQQIYKKYRGASPNRLQRHFIQAMFVLMLFVFGQGIFVVNHDLELETMIPWASSVLNLFICQGFNLVVWVVGN